MKSVPLAHKPVSFPNVVTYLLSEAALDLPCVDASKQDLLAVALEPHLAALVAQVQELYPVDEALGVEGGVFDLVVVGLQLSADDSALAPLVRLVRVLVKRQAVKHAWMVAKFSLLFDSSLT